MSASPRHVSPLAAPAVLHWKLAAFADLSVTELYELLQLRTEVFVMEQNCPFQDMDGADALAMHLLGRHAPQPAEILGPAGQGGEPGQPLVAYARLFPAGIKFAEASIGRVVTRGTARGQGLGHLLIEEALSSLHAVWGSQPVRIGAQARLAAYYNQHGFVDMGLPYVEDGIDHLEMLWSP